MSNTSITNVEITDTFQIWISKTNEVIDILNENVMLAGPGPGFIIAGNSELIGNFKATSIAAETASLGAITTSTITRSTDIALPIEFLSPIILNSSQENLITLQTSAGSKPSIRLINGAGARWAFGQSTPAANTPITIGIEGSVIPQLTLTQTGNLTVTGTITSTGTLNGDLIGNVTGNLIGDVFAINGITRVLDSGNGTTIPAVFTGNVVGNLTGNVTGNLIGDVYASNGTSLILDNGNGTTIPALFTGNVSGTVSSLSNHTTSSLLEPTTNPINLYFTTARARAAISAAGDGIITYNTTTGVITLTQATVRAQFSPGTGVAITAGAISIGQAVAITSAVNFASVTTSGALSAASLTTSGTISATGAITSNGDITAFNLSSDIRKKENVVRIDNALDKVMQIGGYTYNFKGDDRKITGVIAQEIEKVLPEVVYDIPDEEYGTSKAIRYGNIVGLLIEAIKELKAEIDELKAR